MLANVFDYRARARRFLPAFAWTYLEGGAEDELTMRRNRAAYAQLCFAPEVMVNVTSLDTSTTIAARTLA